MKSFAASGFGVLGDLELDDRQVGDGWRLLQRIGRDAEVTFDELALQRCQLGEVVVVAVLAPLLGLVFLGARRELGDALPQEFQALDEIALLRGGDESHPRHLFDAEHLDAAARDPGGVHVVERAAADEHFDGRPRPAARGIEVADVRPRQRRRAEAQRRETQRFDREYPYFHHHSPGSNGTA